MINHNTRNGFPSTIVNELYKPETVRIYSTEDHQVRRQRMASDVYVTHDMFGSSLAIRLHEEFYVISLDRIIEDILEVEHENETLFSDR